MLWFRLWFPFSVLLKFKSCSSGSKRILPRGFLSSRMLSRNKNNIRLSFTWKLKAGTTVWLTYMYIRICVRGKFPLSRSVQCTFPTESQENGKRKENYVPLSLEANFEYHFVHCLSQIEDFWAPSFYFIVPPLHAHRHLPVCTRMGQERTRCLAEFSFFIELFPRYITVFVKVKNVLHCRYHLLNHLSTKGGWQFAHYLTCSLGFITSKSDLQLLYCAKNLN